jgi:hypothetical protein
MFLFAPRETCVHFWCWSAFMPLTLVFDIEIRPRGVHDREHLPKLTRIISGMVTACTREISASFEIRCQHSRVSSPSFGHPKLSIGRSCSSPSVHSCKLVTDQKVRHALWMKLRHHCSIGGRCGLPWHLRFLPRISSVDRARRRLASPVAW